MPHQTLTQNIVIGNALISGDVNQDFQIDILDVIIIVNIILNNHQANEQEFWCADINSDGIINIQDVIIIVQNILEN